MEFAEKRTETAEGWNEWHAENAAVSEGAVAIATDPALAYVSPEPAIADPPDPFPVVDGDTDGCGLLYLLTGSGDRYRYDAGLERLERLDCTWFEGGPEEPSAVCVTDQSVLVADAGAGRVHAFSRHLGQTRWFTTGPLVSPVALARADGTVLVLDAGGGGSDDGDAADATGFLATVGPGGDVETVRDGLTAARDLAVDDDGRALLLVRRDGRDAVVRLDGEYAESSVVEVPGDLEPTCVEAGSGDEVLVGVEPGSAGEPSLYRRHPERGTFEPVAGVPGRCRGLFVRRTGPDRQVERLYAIAGDVAGDGGDTGGQDGGTGGQGDADATGDDRAVYGVEPRPQRRRDEETLGYDARLVRRFDSGVPGTQWHRVTLDRELGGPGTHVRVRHHATDDGSLRYDDLPTDLEAVDGIGQTYAGRLRDAGVEDVEELVEHSPAWVAGAVSTDSHDVSTARTTDWLTDAEYRLEAANDVRGVEWATVTGPDPTDALLDDAVGRYLWVELELVGDRFSTPTVGGFTGYAPRQSYLRHLPAIYREDGESAAFLERFLSIFESVFAGVESDIDAASRFLHPDGVPAEYVDWLEGWLALEADDTWPEPARRELIRRAPELFGKRGTRDGLLALLGIFLDHAASVEDDAPGGVPASEDDPLAFVLEYGDLDCIDSEAAREPFERLVPCPQCYLVFVRSFLDDDALRTVERIVEAERPAHAAGRAVRLQPWAELGQPAYLGVNTLLPSREFVVEEAGLGADTVLVEREAYGHLDLRSRLGTDTVIS